jgi:hypothetical protein
MRVHDELGELLTARSSSAAAAPGDGMGMAAGAWKR